MIAAKGLTDFTMLAVNLEQAKRQQTNFKVTVSEKKSDEFHIETDKVEFSQSALETLSRSNTSSVDRQMADNANRIDLLNSIQAVQKTARDAAESVRISLEKGEVWVYDSAHYDPTDPNNKAYRLQNQPANFSEYVGIMKKAADELPSVVKQFQDDYDKIGSSSQIASGGSSISLTT